MAKMTPRQRILTALEVKEPDRVPFADWIDPGIRKEICLAFGAEDFDDAEFAERIGFDAIDFHGFYDWFPIADVTVLDERGYLQYTGKGLIKSENDLSQMDFPDPHDDRTYEKAKGFVDHYGKKDLALYAGLRSGMMGTIFSLGWEGFSDALYDNIGLVKALMDRYLEWNCVVVDRLQTIGFDFFIIYDDFAYKTGPMFSPQVFTDIFLPKLRILADAVRIPWVFHSDGDLTPVLDDLLTLGMNGLNPIEPGAMDMKTIKAQYGDRISLWGNIDLRYALTRGTPEDTEAEVKQRIREAGPGGGYILGSSNSITDWCKVENVLAMARAVKKYGEYPLNLD
jgi:uroporphyrinogen decarboxylase